jgi:hypothetical protein
VISARVVRCAMRLSELAMRVGRQQARPTKTSNHKNDKTYRLSLRTILSPNEDEYAPWSNIQL